MKYILSSCLILIFSVTFSQNTYSTKSKKAIKSHKEAQRLFEGRSNEEALEYNLKSLKADPEFIEAIMLQAYIYLAQNNYQSAIGSFEKVLSINPAFFPGNHLDLGALYYKTQQYDKAVEILNHYINKYHPKTQSLEKAQMYLASAEFSKHALQNPVPFQPENLGDKVNSEYRDYNPILDVAESKLIFTRTIPDQSTPSGAREDIYLSYLNKNNWSSAFSLGAPLNTNLREGAPSLTADGQTMVLTICESYGDYGRGRNGLGSCDLFVSRFKQSVWSNPRNLGQVVNSKYFDSQSSISSNGNQIYFSSSRPGGKGGSDIYVTEIKEGKFSTPKNLGDVINTFGNEEGVFIHPDNQTLYFTSTGHPGLGLSDIFMSRRQEDGTWGKPINLGYPINTAQSEWGLTIDASAKYAYFSSDREGGFGEMDIYRFPIHEAIKPKPVTYLAGVVFDKTTKYPVDAKFELIDLKTKKSAYSSYADFETGEFFVCLPAGKDYLLNVSKDGYLFHSENFTLTESKNMEPYKKDIALTPIKTGVPVVLKNIFFDTDKFDLKEQSFSELEILLSFLNNNSSLTIEISGHTDNRGDKTHNQTLSKNRAKAVYTYLINKGIATERLQFKGYGEEKPIASNETEEGRAQNRRTEFVIVK